MGALDGGHCKILRGLDIFNPPLGSTYAGTSYLTASQNVELAGLCVVARVRGKCAATCLRNAENAVEESWVAVPEPVVKCCEIQVVTCHILGILPCENGLLRHVQEEVPLEAEAFRGGLEGNDAAVVRVVHEREVHEGVVLEHDLAHLRVGIHTQEGTETVCYGVVDKHELGEFRSLAKVDTVTAYGAVSIDVVDVAAVEAQLSNLHRLAPLIKESLGECANFAIPVDYAANRDSFPCGALLVLDEETAGLLGTVAHNALEIDVSVDKTVGNVDASEDYRHGPVRSAFTVNLEALGCIETLCKVGADAVWRALHLEEHVRTVGDTLGEGGRSRDDRQALRIRHRPCHNLTAVCAGVVEHEVILGGRLETGDRCLAGSYILGRELIYLSLFRSVDAVFDAVHLRIRVPAEADA